MRNLVIGLLLVSSTASADIVVNETTVHDTTTTVEVKLDASTVLCSSADYGALFLKILIPQLSGLTLLDHQNTGAGAPCVAAGPCAPGNRPSDIINGYPTESTDINVKAIRIDEVDTDAKTCTTTLRETVDVTIRGKQFTHERYSSLGERPFSDCATSPQAPTPPNAPEENKADDYGSKSSSNGGGCSTTGGSASFAVLLVGLLAIRRRRRS